MPDYRIDLDPRNPGQFLACCGLFELADLAAPGGSAYFSDDCLHFTLQTEAAFPPPLLSLKEAGSLEDKPYDEGLEPLELEAYGKAIDLNWWLVPTLTKKSDLKTHGGPQKPRDLQKLLDVLEYNVPVETILKQNAFTTTRFGVDFRSAWDAQDLGYSPNDLAGQAKNAVTFPWVEVLAVVGLQGFRPAPQVARARYRYYAWQQPLPISVARAACAVPWKGLKVSAFEFRIGTRGQGFKTFLQAKGVN